MSQKSKTRHSQGWVKWFIPLFLIELTALITYLIYDKNIALFQSKGFIAHEQRDLMIFIVILLLVASVPTLSLLYFTAWKYRESNTRAVHKPNARQGKLLVAVMWTIPTAFVMVAVAAMWPATHRLEPRDAIASDKKPITIQVISMRWKWLFLYPEQNIATVNFVQIPEDTPVVFELTGDEAPMSSFWIPNLGGQLYSMTSHVNSLNLMADEPGDYPGSSAEINGPGFAGMKFTARVSSADDFDRWVDKTQQASNVLDTAAYANLLKPSENNPTAFYRSYQAGLYDKVVMKYTGSHDHKPATYEAPH